MLNGLALRRITISLLETVRQPMTVFTMSLCTRNPTPSSCLSSLPLKYNLWPSSVDVSPKFFYRTSQRTKMFQRYLLISYDNSSNLPAIRKVFSFQKPIVILFLARILLVVTPVANFSPPSWCAREGAVLFDPGDDRSGMGWEMVIISCGVSWANKALQSPTLSKPGLGSKVPSSRWASGQEFEC